MSDTEHLRNRGVWALNASSTDCPEKTVIVLGAARGGTSMVAGTLHHLGIAMGEQLSLVYEDVALSEAVEKGDTTTVDRIIAERNARHAVWGWKRPDAIRYAALWRRRFRNPCYVVVFRDLFAIANRNRISMQSGVIRNMARSHEVYGQILQFIGSETAPILLVSYEKAVLDARNFVTELRNFVNMGDAARVEAAIRFVQPEPDAYLRATRITNSIGHLAPLSDRRINGWAFYRNAPTRAAKVRIKINGMREYVVLANRLRPRLKEKGLHPTGECGFVLLLSEAERLKPGDRVEARVVDDVADINNSPRVLDGASTTG